MKPSVRTGLAYGFFRAVALPIRLLQASVLGRYLGTEGYGLLGYVISWSNLLGGPYIRVTLATVTREVSRLSTSDRYGAICSLLYSLGKINTGVASALLLLSLALFTLPDTDLLGEYKWIIIWGCIHLSMKVLFAVCNGLLRASHKPTVGLVLEDIVRPLIIIIGVVWYQHDHTEGTTPAEAMMWLAIASFVVWAAASAIWQWGTTLGRACRLAADQRVFRRFGIGTRRAIPLAKVAFIQIAYAEAVVLVLGVCGGLNDLGIYRAATQLSLFVSFGLQCSIVVLQPHASAIRSGGSVSDLQQLVTLASRIGTITAIAAAIVLIVFGPTIITLVFGESYEPAYLVLVVLCVARVVSVGMGPTSMLLNMTRHESTVIKRLLIATALSVILAVSLSPFLGAIGAAASFAISVAYWKIALWRDTKTTIGVDASVFNK